VLLDNYGREIRRAKTYGFLPSPPVYVLVERHDPELQIVDVEAIGDYWDPVDDGEDDSQAQPDIEAGKRPLLVNTALDNRL